MRGLTGLVALLLLSGGCSREPSFDETFNQHAADIEARADKMQKDLSNRMNAAASAAEAKGQAKFTRER